MGDYRQWTSGGIISIEKGLPIRYLGSNMRTLPGTALLEASDGSIQPHVAPLTQVEIEDEYVRFAMFDKELVTIWFEESDYEAFTNPPGHVKERVILTGKSSKTVALYPDRKRVPLRGTCLLQGPSANKPLEWTAILTSADVEVAKKEFEALSGEDLQAIYCNPRDLSEYNKTLFARCVAG